MQDQEQFNALSAADKHNVTAIVKFLKTVYPTPPDFGVIAGSGLSELHEILEGRTCVAYKDIPGFLGPLSGSVSKIA